MTRLATPAFQLVTFPGIMRSYLRPDVGLGGRGSCRAFGSGSAGASPSQTGLLPSLWIRLGRSLALPNRGPPSTPRSSRIRSRDMAIRPASPLVHVELDFVGHRALSPQTGRSCACE